MLDAFFLRLGENLVGKTQWIFLILTPEMLHRFSNSLGEFLPFWRDFLIGTLDTSLLATFQE